MKFAIFILTLCFSIACANAQPGCTDPQALNFDAAATQNDGSCTYPSTTYLPPPIAELPADLEEASGLAFFDHQLWTHRDGGNGSDLYVIDTLTGEVLQPFPQLGLLNVDWEDLAEDADYFYIGDFGNNVGNRNDLRIIRSWPNQTEVTVRGLHHPQADSPDDIGHALAAWYDTLG